jgi:hypothetical protein
MNGSPPPLSRRGFLVLSGGTAAVLGISGCGSSLLEEEPLVHSTATALTGGFPRMLGFRQSEMHVPLKPYSEWEPIFAQFSGIIGKAIQEERSDIIGPQTVDYFTRYKQRYPAKLVLLHLNGRARLPTFETDGWSAGWWLYRLGSKLTSAVGPDDTVLKVVSTGRFQLRTDAFGHAGDDIVLAEMGADGKPDFSAAEQVRLTALDATAKTLTVKRGLYGTSALSFPSGAYLAPHEYAGPWSATDDRVWMYNLSTMCPVDATGGNVVDALIEQIAAWFGPGGRLAAFDGLQLDVFQIPLTGRTGVDADCDGTVDLAMQDGVDTYLQGQIELTRRLRQALGSGRYLITDCGVGQQPDTASVTGVELEGFPTSNDYGITLWSQALTTLDLWRLRGANPRLSYPLYKFGEPNSYPVSFNRFRLTLAAALATNSPVSWFNDIGGASGEANEVVVWDELVAGTAGTPGWLGAVRADTVRLAERRPDVLAGKGVKWPSSFVNTFSGAGVKFAVQSPSAPVLAVSRRQASETLTFSIPDLALTGPDAVLALDLLAVKRAAYPATIGRQCTVKMAGSDGELEQTVAVPTTWFHVVLGFHGVGPGPVKVTFTIEGDPPLKLRGMRMFASPDAIARGFANGAMFANPSGSAFTFDVAGLFPGRRFARINGSVDQDPATNDGSALGSTLTLDPLDALVVRSV